MLRRPLGASTRFDPSPPDETPSALTTHNLWTDIHDLHESMQDMQAHLAGPAYETTPPFTLVVNNANPQPIDSPFGDLGEFRILAITASTADWLRIEPGQQNVGGNVAPTVTVAQVKQMLFYVPITGLDFSEFWVPIDPNMQYVALYNNAAFCSIVVQFRRRIDALGAWRLGQ